MKPTESEHSHPEHAHPEHADPELDGFWCELREQVVPDYLPRETADLRMVADAPPLPEATVHRIVDRVTRKAALSSPPPRPATGSVNRLWQWRFTQAAAAGTLTALLLSAGMIYVLWPENADSFGIHGEAMRYDAATSILTDSREGLLRRKSALIRVYDQVGDTIKVLRELSAAGGELGKAADVYLLRIRLSLGSPQDVRFETSSIPQLQPFFVAAGDVGLSDAARAEALTVLGEEALHGISCIIDAGAIVSGDARFDAAVSKLLSRLTAFLDK